MPQGSQGSGGSLIFPLACNLSLNGVSQLPNWNLEKDCPCVFQRKCVSLVKSAHKVVQEPEDYAELKACAHLKSRLIRLW